MFRPFSIFVVICLAVTLHARDAVSRTLPKDFQERQLQDWILQDAPENALPWTDTAGHADEAAMLEKVLTEIEASGRVPAELRGEFQGLVADAKPGSDPAWKTLYEKSCALRRQIRLTPVREQYPEIIYARHQVLGGSHYAYTEAPSDAQHPERRDMLGGKLYRLTILPDGSTQETLLVEAPDRGTLRDPDVSYDGKRIVFSMRSHDLKDDYHLYDYDIETGKVRQLTFGPGFADVEPCYLPDGNILFCSTRCMQIVDCWWTDVTNLYMCDPDGRFLHRVSFDQVHTNYPKTLDDGRVIYTRWDYNDRGQIYPQPLFMMNYDATGQTEYYGNNSWFPTTIMHARGIPGSAKVVAIASGHHSHQRGKLIVIDRSQGTQENEGVTLIAPPRETKAEHIDAYGQDGEQFQYPLALDEENFIVAYTPDGFPEQNRYDIPFGLYYMDIDNAKRELLAWDPKVSTGQPVPLKGRDVPVMRASPVDYNQHTGSYYVQDVYEGPGLEGVERGTIKELRIVALDFRAAGMMSNGNRGPAGGALVSTPISIDNGSWDVKKVLGTVPVEKDGSAYFEVPARTPVYFQLLDERGYTVQTMRSWSTLQPGEMFSCIGCHEAKGATRNNPLSRGGAMRTQALRRAPKHPKPLEPAKPGLYENAGFSFERTIQPILDQKCVECHHGGRFDEKIEKGEPPFSLLGNRYEPFFRTKKNRDGDDEQRPDVNMAGRRFSDAYINLTRRGRQSDVVNWRNVQSAPPMLPPYTAGAAGSLLPEMFDDDKRAPYHEHIRLTDLEKRKFALWIDLLVPFSGAYAESVDWSDEQKAEYAYYQNKRDRMAEIEAENIAKLLAQQPGAALPAPETFTRFEEGGPEFKRKFTADWVNARKSLPVVGRLEGDENLYRNLAFNPGAAQGEPVSYPHATTNSEFAGLPCFAAKNVLDGIKENAGHGPKFPSWGPHKRTDLYLTLEFGRPVEIDKIVLWLRADFSGDVPHDTVWKSGTLKFSDGTSLDVTFDKTADPQSFSFEKRTVTAVTLTDLVQDFPLGWTGLVEMEVWGRDVAQ